jgi:hypothetical protein
MINGKSQMNQIKRDIQKWKKEGYKVDDIERLVLCASDYNKSRLIKKIINISIISTLLSSIFILITIPFGLIHGNQFAKAIDMTFESASFSVGFPLHWFKIVYTKPTAGVLYIDEIFMVNPSNVVMNLLVYIVVLFSIFYFFDFLYLKIKKNVL